MIFRGNCFSQLPLKMISTCGYLTHTTNIKVLIWQQETFQILIRIIAKRHKREETLRENHLEPILVFAPVQRNIQNLVSPDYSSSFKNQVS